MSGNVVCVRCVAKALKTYTPEQVKESFVGQSVNGPVVVYSGKSYCVPCYADKVNGVQPWKVETTEEKLGISEPAPWSCNYFSPVGMGKCVKPVPHKHAKNGTVIGEDEDE